MRLPEGTTEFYVVSSTDVKSNNRLLYKAFHVIARVAKDATWELHWAIVGKENLLTLTEQAKDINSKNVYIKNGTLCLLDTVNKGEFEEDLNNPFELDDDFLLYEEEYEGSFWWLLDILYKANGEVILREGYSTPVQHIRFSNSTMTLYYSYLKENGEWSSTKLLWYTDDFYVNKNLKVKLTTNDYLKYKQELTPYINSEQQLQEEGITKVILTVDFSKARLITKELDDIRFYFVKELLIKDVMLSQMASAKNKGASHAKFVLEHLMGIEPEEDFKELAVASKVVQSKNLVFELEARTPTRTYILDTLTSDEYQPNLLKYLETEDNSLLSPLADKIIKDYGLSVFTKEYFMGLVNSFHVDDEGLFDYKTHNDNVKDYREEFFYANLNLHKERIQLFIHQFNLHNAMPNSYLQGGEYRLLLKAKKVNYNG